MGLIDKVPLGVREYVAKFIGSRKWLLALGVTIVFLTAREWESAVTVVVAYLGVEGGSDALVKWQARKHKPAGD